MEQTIYILVIEDEPEVLDAIVRDIEPFEEKFPIEAAESAEEARTIIEEIFEEGARIGLILSDHVLPQENGVELLSSMQDDNRLEPSRKVLITGQAGLEDTVKAVNQANLNHYIAKPWDKEQLQQVVRDQLTDYVLENCENQLPYMDLLDAERIAEHLRKTGGVSDF